MQVGFYLDNGRGFYNCYSSMLYIGIKTVWLINNSHTRKRVNAHTHIHALKHAHTHANTHKHAHTNTHIHMYIYKYI